MPGYTDGNRKKIMGSYVTTILIRVDIIMVVKTLNGAH